LNLEAEKMAELGKEQLRAIFEFPVYIMTKENGRRVYILPTDCTCRFANALRKILGGISFSISNNALEIKNDGKKSWAEIDEKVLNAISCSYTLLSCTLTTGPIPKTIGPC
jgi:hypothetical protein